MCWTLGERWGEEGSWKSCWVAASGEFKLEPSPFLPSQQTQLSSSPRRGLIEYRFFVCFPSFSGGQQLKPSTPNPSFVTSLDSSSRPPPQPTRVEPSSSTSRSSTKLERPPTPLLPPPPLRMETALLPHPRRQTRSRATTIGRSLRRWCSEGG